MADFDFSLLDIPRNEPPADADDYLRTAIAWHFGVDTGSPYWLRTAPTLGFDPLCEVTTFEDLRRFPNVVDELRSAPVEDLIPGSNRSRVGRSRISAQAVSCPDSVWCV
jgi:hypothetical protein